MTQNIGTNYTVTVADLTDDASIIEAFKYYHQGGLTGSPAPNSLEQHLIDVNDRAQGIENSIGYVTYDPVNNGTASPTSTVNARLISLESIVGTSLAATYIKAIPSSNDVASTRNLIQPSLSTVIPLAVQGVVGQTADLQQWKTSAATVAKVTSSGTMYSYDGSSMAEVATLSGTQTLTNKTLNNPITTIGTNARTASYTIVLTDQSKLIEYNSASAGTITVPANASVAFPIGTYMVIMQTGAGQITISPSSGVTLNYTPGNKTRTQWSMATLIKRSTDTWVVAGDLIA